MHAQEHGRSRLAWPMAYAVAGVLLFAVYLSQSARGTYVTSDGASNALQAWAMLHGNLLLHGWTMSDVSFYTTELPEFMLVEAVRGPRPEVVHICAALTYTLLVLLAAALAKGEAPGREAVTRALLAAGIMLAPQLGLQSGVLLASPDHVGTGVPLLLVWLLIDRGATARDATARDAGRGSGRWLVPALAGFILAWTAVGDQLAEVIGAVPLVLVCLLRIGQGLRRSRGRRVPEYELSLLVAAVLSILVAPLVIRAIAASGGWTITSVRTGLAGAGSLPQHAYLTGMGLLQLFGADFLGQPTAWQTAFAVVHLTGVAVAACGFCLAVRRFLSAELLVQVLTVAIVVNLCAYLFSVQAQDIANTREIASVLPFSAVLAGRLLAGRLTKPGQLTKPGRLPAIASVAGAALLAGYVAMLGVNASQPPVAGKPADLAAWLTAHDLTRGLGGYWQANSVTLISGGAVQVRAIDVANDQLITGSYWEADQGWYDPATQYADFVVDVPDQPGNPQYPGVLIRSMTAEAGKPDRLYLFGDFAIAVWKTNLLTRFR
jgi:hypothetical protein